MGQTAAWRGAIALLVLLLCQGSAAAAVSVPDDGGRMLRLERPAERIVALAPDLVELVYAVGAGQRLVGVIERSDYPAAAKELPRIGSASGLDLERILALKPDLVLAWDGGNAAAQIARLEKLGLTVYHSDMRSFEDIEHTLRRLGELTGQTREAQAAAAGFKARIENLRRQYAGKPRLSVFYQVWGQPLYTLGGAHIVSRALDLCGADNAFADLQPLAAAVELEAVLRRDPQVIVAAADAGVRPAWLDDWKRWPRLAAVRRDALIVVDADLMNRHSARLADATAVLCAELDRRR